MPKVHLQGRSIAKVVRQVATFFLQKVEKKPLVYKEFCPKIYTQVE